MRDNLLYGIVIVVILIIIGTIGYGLWHAQKRWNYSWGYEEMVKQTVREMVKAEALKESKK